MARVEGRRSNAAPLGRGVDPEFTQLAVEGRTADAQLAGDQRHPPLIFLERQPNHLGLDLGKRADVAVLVEGGDVVGPVARGGGEGDLDRFDRDGRVGLSGASR